ncbi:WD40/YVTN/BNR-like repeat-containing protein [Micromonospora sp. SL1-18]|uniref:WD40/YVTN/BNR-like repeat-containing protein n=1 Tax=Micromonospora sp. SL1-18 TaxID=3399128 RepID=UPI003A4D8F54
MQFAAAPATPAAAAASEPYSWKNIRIDGGGFVPGIVFNQTEKNLIYARTDIGGAYRWEQSTQSWAPLLDWVGADKWGWNGVVSLATDPVQTNRVYAAVGMYTNSWDPNNGAILRSTDKGATWQATALPFKNGGNMPGRGMGERLAVDPNKNSILYYGAEGGNGLWRSTDYGATWAKVANFPSVGNYRADPNDSSGYQSQNQGLTWVSFDKSTGTAGNTTQTIYIGVADKANPVYRTTNGGTTWERIPGQPTGYLAHKGVVDLVGGYLYIATSDTGGPYDGGKGDVWKFNRATGAWMQISPIPSSSGDAYFGYSDHLRHHRTDQVGHRWAVHGQADGQGPGGDRRTRPDQPALRRPADQRARRHRRLPAHRPGRGAVDDVHPAGLHQHHQPRLRRDQAVGAGSGGQLQELGPAQRPARRILHRRRGELVPGQRTGRD